LGRWQFLHTSEHAKVVVLAALWSGLSNSLRSSKAPARLTEGVPYLKKNATPEPPKEPAK
jgi:hypothetical protein